MSSFVPVEIQLACFAFTVLLSVSFFVFIKAQALVPHALRFIILRWACEQAVMFDVNRREWFFFPTCVGIFGIVGSFLTILGVPFPYSFYISFIVAALWIYYRQRD